ncbi:MAG: sensor histidine kinase [Bacteroidales bacterium]
MRITAVILMVLLGFQAVHAQKEGQARIDSLLSELPKIKEDTTKVRLLATICFEMRNINPRQALNHGLEALQISERLNYAYGEGIAHYALIFIYHFLSLMPKSLDHALQAEKIFENLRDKEYLCASYLMLAFLYLDLDAEISSAYIVKAKALLPLNRPGLWKARNYGTLGNNYRNMDQLDSARKYMNLHLKMAEEYHLNGEIMIEKNRFGYLYMKESKLDSAFALISAGLAYFKSIQSFRMVSENYTTLGKIRFRQGTEKGPMSRQYLREAENYAMVGLEYATKIGYLYQIFAANKLLSDIYIAEGNNRKALEYLRTAFSNYDSIYGAQIVSKASALSWKSAEQLKEKQMELLKLHNRQQLIFVYAAIIGVLILVIIVLIIIRSRMNLKKSYILVNEQRNEISRQQDALKESQAHLVQSEKMASLGMLTLGIAHEINNPVNFINSAAISLQKDYDDLKKIIGSIEKLPPETRKLADELALTDLLEIIPQTIADIQIGVQRTTEIVKGLRNFTRMDVSEMKEADLIEGINSTLLLLNHKIKDRIEIIRDFDPELGYIKCYPGQLNQVFMNLINNAIDAIEQKKKETPGVTAGSGETGPSYQIRISAKLTAEGDKKIVQIDISDEGSGIRDEIRDKLFDPFFTTRDVGQGTGLGLFISQGIIAKHGGTITFESSEGKGTTFTIRIPGEMTNDE